LLNTELHTTAVSIWDP